MVVVVVVVVGMSLHTKVDQRNDDLIDEIIEEVSSIIQLYLQRERTVWLKFISLVKLW